MNLSLALLVIAAGAILAFAVEDDWDWLDTGAAGVIMMLVGLVYLLLTVLFATGVVSTGRRRPPPPDV